MHIHPIPKKQSVDKDMYNLKTESSLQHTVIRFIRSSPTNYRNFVKILFAFLQFYYPIEVPNVFMSRQLPIETCAKLWPNLMVICHVTATLLFTRLRLWAEKLFVKYYHMSISVDYLVDHVYDYAAWQTLPWHKFWTNTMEIPISLWIELILDYTFHVFT